jgi:hypothetical protein
VVAIPRKSSADPNRSSVPEEGTPRAARPSGWRRLRRLVIGATIGGTLLVACAPLIVARTALRHRIVPLVFPDYPGRVETGGATLNWFSPVVLRDVVAHDTDGRPLLTAARVVSEKTLAELALDTVRVGGWTVERPQVRVALRAGGSNLEDALAPMLAAEGGGAVEYTLSVRDGSAVITDTTGEAPGAAADGTRTLRLSGLTLDLKQPLSTNKPLTVRMAADVDAGGSGGGSFAAELTWTPAAAPDGVGNGSVKLEARDVHLGPLSAILKRCGSPATLDGVAVGRLDASWSDTDDGPDARLSGRLTATRFAAFAPAALAGDTLRVEFVTADLAGGLHGGQVALDRCAVNSDVLRADARGRVALTALTDGFGPASLERLLQEADLSFEADVNLDRLGATLPQTLALRDGLKITDGQLQVRIGKDQKDQRDGSPAWTGRLAMDRLVAEVDGRSIVWDRPIEVTAAVRPTADGPRVDELTCASDFLTVRAAGRVDDATIEATCDLDRLSAEAGRFVDLGGVELSGRLRTRLTTRRTDAGRWHAELNASAERFDLAAPDRPRWREDGLNVTASADVIDGERRRIEAAEFRLVSAGDELSVRQTAPATLPLDANPLAARAELRGDLATWAVRLRPLVDLSDFELRGRTVLSADLEIAADVYTVRNLVADCEPLSVRGGGVAIDQPRVRATGDAVYRADSGRLTSESITWASQSLSLRADGVRMDLGETRPQVAGTVVFQALTRDVLRWFTGPPAPGAPGTSGAAELHGVATGQVGLFADGPRTRADWHIVIKDATLQRPIATQAQPPGQPRQLDVLYSDPQITTRGRGEYDAESDRIDLAECVIEAKAATLRAGGAVAALSTRGEANLSGELTCDAAELTRLLSPWIGEGVRLSGGGTRPFAVRGPLWGGDVAGANQATSPLVPKGLAAHAAVAWDAMDVHGLSGGASALSVSISDGTLRVGPLDQPLSGGNARLGASLPLAEPLVATVDRGTGVENLTLSPELCGRWIKYMVPMLAGSAEADGRLSVRLESGSVPLADWTRADAAGTLGVEHARVRPGPVAGELVKLATQVKRLLGQGDGRVTDPNADVISLPKQNVEFRVAGGRVTHQDLKLIVAGAEVTTRGTVGFDESLALVAEIPLPAGWLGSNKALAGLQGQKLQVPIGGTLSRPMIDARVLQDLARRLAEATAKGFLNRNLNLEDRLPIDGLPIDGLGRKLFGDSPAPSQPNPSQPNPAQPTPSQPGTIPPQQRLEDEIEKNLNRLFKGF